MKPMEPVGYSSQGFITQIAEIVGDKTVDFVDNERMPEYAIASKKGRRKSLISRASRPSTEGMW